MKIFFLYSIIFIGLLFQSCNDSARETERLNEWNVELPSHFDSLPIPLNNPMNKAKVELGARLFYDPLLSIDSSLSCASCHIASFAFSDGKIKSRGQSDSLTFRNSPVLFNLAYAPYFMMDGGVPTLELQIVAPLMHENEMGFDLFKLSDRLAENEIYQELSLRAFDRELDPAAIAYSIAAFERSLLSYQSKYDAYLSEDKSVFDEEEKRGFDLFYSDSLNCSSCHSGINFSNYKFYNIGLYQSYTDPGRWRITEKAADIGKFKVPTLRNIEYSAPYMHDGSFATLEEVITFKMSGGKTNENKSDTINSFQLNENDQKSLLSFLKSLSDPIFVEREIQRREKL